MASNSSYFDPTSSFVKLTSDAFYTVINEMLRKTAEAYHARLSEVIQVCFSDEFLTRTILNFKRYLISLIHHCCNVYLTIHQQIVDKKLEKSDLNENNEYHHDYLIIETLMLQNGGYKHINCIYDGLIMICMLQFKYVSAALSRDTPLIGSSSSNRDGNFTAAELSILNYILQRHLSKANENLQNLYINDDEYKNHRLKCEENNSCQLPIEDLLQRLKDQEKFLEQQIADLPGLQQFF